MSGWNADVFTIRARKCLRCGRLLTSAEAIEKGYGCQCEMKALAEQRLKEPVPGQATIFDWINDGVNKKEEQENE
jgi:DNA-directed RNA polymerase subunit RPC12/RpoP